VLAATRRLGYHSNVRLNIKRRRRVQPPACGDLCNVPCFKEELVARVKRDMPSDEALDEARVLFAALADRTRLRILHSLLLADELCVCDVAHVLGMSVAAASHHLRKLRQLGILKLRNDGKMAYYSLRDRFAAELATHAVRQAAA
jgi:DNA-binding transcriptional ArsR family regulator